MYYSESRVDKTEKPGKKTLPGKACIDLKYYQL